MQRRQCGVWCLVAGKVHFSPGATVSPLENLQCTGFGILCVPVSQTLQLLAHESAADHSLRSRGFPRVRSCDLEQGLAVASGMHEGNCQGQWWQQLQASPHEQGLFGKREQTANDLECCRGGGNASGRVTSMAAGGHVGGCCDGRRHSQCQLFCS